MRMCPETLASDSYRCRRAWLKRYFDRTPAAAWTELTSEKSVGAIRARVRAGRDRRGFALARVLARVLPVGSRPPSVEPVSETGLRGLLAAEPRLATWRPARSARSAARAMDRSDGAGRASSRGCLTARNHWRRQVTHVFEAPIPATHPAALRKTGTSAPTCRHAAGRSSHPGERAGTRWGS